MLLKNSPESGKRPLLWQQFLIVAITLTVVAVAILLGRQTYRETRKMAIEQFNRQQLMLARSAAIGIGIPEDDLPHLFSRFHRGRNTAAYPGSGLGLAIVRALGV